MAKQHARPGDLTGQLKAQLAEEHAVEVEARASQIALVTAQAAAKQDEVIDLAPKVPEVKEEVIGEITVTEVDLNQQVVEFRTNDTFSCTLGHGNDYDFVEGQKVRAPKWIYTHLDEKGLVWH